MGRKKPTTTKTGMACWKVQVIMRILNFEEISSCTHTSLINHHLFCNRNAFYVSEEKGGAGEKSSEIKTKRQQWNSDRERERKKCIKVQHVSYNGGLHTIELHAESRYSPNQKQRNVSRSVTLHLFSIQNIIRSTQSPNRANFCFRARTGLISRIIRQRHFWPSSRVFFRQ